MRSCFCFCRCRWRCLPLSHMLYNCADADTIKSLFSHSNIPKVFHVHSTMIYYFVLYGQRQRRTKNNALLNPSTHKLWTLFRQLMRTECHITYISLLLLLLFTFRAHSVWNYANGLGFRELDVMFLLVMLQLLAFVRPNCTCRWFYRIISFFELHVSIALATTILIHLFSFFFSSRCVHCSFSLVLVFLFCS